jgi:hypothetical protein
MYNKIFSIVLMVICLVAVNVSFAGEIAVELVSSTSDTIFNNFLTPQKRGWLGADGASSVKLTDDKILWLFGDSLLGTLSPKGEKKGFMARNTIAIQDISQGLPGKVDFYWDMTDDLPGSYFLGGGYDMEYWYWPGVGAMVDGELFLFCYKVMQGDEAFGGLGFKISEMVLFRITNPLDSPDKWNIVKTDLGIGGDHQSFFTAVYVQKPYFYLLGFDDKFTANDKKRNMILARAEIDGLKHEKGAESFEFWANDNGKGKWSKSTDNLLPLFEYGLTESSLHYDSGMGLYVCITQVTFSSDIYVVTSPELTGPWSDPIKVYTIPELPMNKNYVAYAAKAHPELTNKSGELIITYVVNTSDFWSMFSDTKIYYPKFVKVQLKRK